MDKIQHIYTYAFLFTLFTCQILSVEGRKMKPMKRTEIHYKERLSNETLSQLQAVVQQNNSSKTAPTYSSAFRDPVPVDKDDFRPAALWKSRHFDHTSERGKADSQTLVESHDMIWTNDFRPTTPGDSPGVGHPNDPHAYDISPNHGDANWGVEHPLSKNSDDYRPTMPGRSPGVGHSSGEETREPNI
ncbi:hypothetical protein Nepgr_027078 [Nepenthes gracilis]|uniref:Uncharacterized protein n=1 Tax=Nepenthes gracilis TaxID=150966 RepID=A0AAD3T804_NEPGR|nr:hypothetical protein Nepgr_027078 [Nepenthes gracilis]